MNWEEIKWVASMTVYGVTITIGFFLLLYCIQQF
jgi:hypothetical protein